MRRLQTTHLCPQKSQTASTRSQLNVPRKCDLILETPKADVNFSAHTRRRCCITGPRITRSIILYKSVCFREARLCRATHIFTGCLIFQLSSQSKYGFSLGPGGVDYMYWREFSTSSSGRLLHLLSSHVSHGAIPAP